MAEGEVKISALPSGSSLTGVEKIPMVQGGVTIEASAQEIADLSIPLINSKQDKSNGVLTGCTITLGSYGGSGTNNDIRVTEGTWRISPSEYGNVGTGNTDFLDIVLSASGLQRYIELVGTTSNTIIKIEGAESAIAVRPTLGAGQVSLGSILVKDALIDPPVPDLSGYVTRNGNETISRNEIFTTTSDIAFGINGIISNKLYISTSQTQLKITNGSKFAGLFLNTDGSDANTRALLSVDTTKYFEIHKLTGGTMYGDIIKYNSDRTTEINANGLALINRAYADSKYLGSLTQSSQAQVEAAFDNTDQATPVVLEQTSALTPFNAWWLVQKIKTWVKAGFTLTGSLNFAPSVSLASSTNPALGATASNNVTITGTTTIAGFDNVADGITRVVKFSGILQLTYNATSLILPTSANITTSAGDIAVFRSLGSGNWECIEYTRRDGTALVSGGSGTTDLSITNRTATTLDVASSTGADATIPQATPSLAGLHSATDKTKSDKYPSTATNNKYLKGNGTSWVEVDSPVTQTITDGVTATAPSEDAVFDKFASLTTAVIADSTNKRYVSDYFINNFPVMKISYYTYTTGAKTFTLSNTPISDLLVMVNGVSLRKTTDWTISGAVVTIPEVVYLDEVSIMFQYAYSFAPVFMYGLDYSTANSYSSIAHSAAIAFNKDSAFTLAIHFAIRTHAVNFLFAKETGGNPFDGYFLRINSNGTIYFSFAALSPSAQGDYFIPSEVLSLNTIYSIVVTKNTSYGTSSAYKIFLNGVELVKTTAGYTLTGSAVTANTNPLLTGAGRVFTFPIYYSEIVTFDQAVFSKELTPVEALLYHTDKGDNIEATIGSVLVHHRHNDQTLPIPDRSGNSRVGTVTALTASQFVSPSSFL